MTERAGICPNCGAEIRFRWSGAVQTTCPSCRSILVRRDVDLERVGTVGDVPASMSRIQLGTEGRFKGTPFEVVGRIVYKYGRGHWSEWHIRTSDGRSAWLSDAQGEYAVTRGDEKWDPPENPPAAGDTLLEVRGREWAVASVTHASYLGVEGELPFEYWDKSECVFVDLKSGTDAFGTIDYSDDPPLAFFGEYESFEELRLTNLREEEEGGPDVATRSLTCPQCGSPIQLHMGDLAQGVACASCTAVMDVTDEGLAIAAEHQVHAGRFKPVIPLGSIASLSGTQWRAIGLQVRCITVDDVDYAWREYLLWNADAGFRYLTEYEGHWNDVSVIRGVPTDGWHGARRVATWLNTTFSHFQHASARTIFVLGEFPWEVRVGDTANTDDYVAPPLMLSRETTAAEVTWSLGTYTDPARIREAFRLKEPLRKPSGVFANQPNPWGQGARALLGLFAVFAAVLAVMFIARRAMATNESVFADAFVADRAAGVNPAAFTTRPFELRGRRSNVEISIETDVANSWAFFNIALLPTAGGAGYELGREVSHYFGVEGGESWREGSPVDEAMLSAVPPGSYYLLVDVDRDPAAARRDLRYEIRVRRDVPRIWPFLVGLLALALPAVFLKMRQATFEYTRWQESDYAATTEDE